MTGEFSGKPDQELVVGLDFRLNPDTGELAATDAALNPGNPHVVAAAYTREEETVLYDIDSETDSLYIQGNPRPTVAPLILVGALGVDTTDAVGFGRRVENLGFHDRISAWARRSERRIFDTAEALLSATFLPHR